MTNKAELQAANQERKELVHKRGLLAKLLKDEMEKQKENEEEYTKNGGWAVFGKLIADIKEVSKSLKQVQDQILGWLDTGALLR